ncbi:MAG: hypothetical protein K9H26_01880 [Prolixibacteraceae bacterium]|nr:hypothetical protein [Prolixibacteraceae bacterium]
MKPIVIFTCIIFLLITACEKDTPPFANEDITISSSMPGFAVYKTKGDYFNYITVKMDIKDTLTMIPAYNANDPRVTVTEDNVVYNLRWYLRSGYTVCREMDINRIFTNITFKELIDHVDSIGGIVPPDEWFKYRIIDKHPFTEFYDLKKNTGRDFTLGEINQMAENGTLETYFTKLK